MNRLRRAALGVLLALGAPGVSGVAAAQLPEPAHTADDIRIVLVGDSTVTEGSGWGLGFRQLVTPEVTVINTAQNGRSSKSFHEEGHWATALTASTNCGA